MGDEDMDDSTQYTDEFDIKSNIEIDQMSQETIYRPKKRGVKALSRRSTHFWRPEQLDMLRQMTRVEKVHKHCHIDDKLIDRAITNAF